MGTKKPRVIARGYESAKLFTLGTTNMHVVEQQAMVFYVFCHNRFPYVTFFFGCRELK